MPAETNHLGVLHGGHMLSWMDMAAWVVAARAVEPDQRVMFKAVTDCVWTASVHAGQICNVDADVAETGSSSIAVDLVATAEDPRRKATWPVCTARFTMVAVGADGRPEPVRLAEPR
jgi:acyl-CoA hydrolase